VVLESTPGSNKETIMQALDKLQAGGSTAGGEGIMLAYRIAEKNFIKGGNNWKISHPETLWPAKQKRRRHSNPFVKEQSKIRQSSVECKIKICCVLF